MKSYVLRTVTGLTLLVAFPLLAGALTQDQITQQVQSLLTQAAQLQQQISTAASSGSFSTGSQASSNTGTNTSSSAAGSSGGYCPTLSSTLGLGSRGSEVSALQQFLAQYPSIYPEGLVSGYFGALTQQAVQRLQAAHGVISSGDAISTGYGLVGFHTRSLIVQLCGSGTPSPSSPILCPQALPPVTSCSTGWKPMSGSDGCTASYRCAIPLLPGNACPAISLSCPVGYQDSVSSTCAHTCVSNASVNTPSSSISLSATPGAGGVPLTSTLTGTAPTGSYTLDFGDGTPVLGATCGSSCSTSVSISQVHTYSSPGTYIAVLKSNGLSVGTTITVTTTSTTASLRASPLLGTPPLTVNFTGYAPTTNYMLDYGDGTPALVTACSGSCSNGINIQLSHTYTTAGTYTATLRSTNTAQTYFSTSVVVIVSGTAMSNTVSMSIPGSVTLTSGQSAIQNSSGLGTIPIFTLNGTDGGQGTASVTVVTGYSCPNSTTCAAAYTSDATLQLNIPQDIGSERFTLLSVSGSTAVIQIAIESGLAFYIPSLSSTNVTLSALGEKATDSQHGYILQLNAVRPSQSSADFTWILQSPCNTSVVGGDCAIVQISSSQITLSLNQPQLLGTVRLNLTQLTSSSANVTLTSTQ